MDGQCPVSLFNQTGDSVSKVRVRHFFGDRLRGEFGPMGMGKDECVRDAFDADYATDIPHHDEWRIEFYLKERFYECVMRCDLDARDDGLPVLLTFSSAQFQVICPESKSCAQKMSGPKRNPDPHQVGPEHGHDISVQRHDLKAGQRSQADT